MDDQQKVIRPKITGANIILRTDGDGDEHKGIALQEKEADELYTSLSTGLIKGASVFETLVYFRQDDGKIMKRPMFINMMHVESIIIDIEEEEE